MRTRRTWGRLLAALAVALVAAVGLAPRAAWAADGNVARVGETEYATLKEAIENAPKDGTEWDIVLIADAAIEKQTVAPTGSNISLNLAGHTVAASKMIIVRGNFVILDSLSGAGKIEGSANTLFSVSGSSGAPAKLLLEGGYVSTTEATGITVSNAYAAFEMTGGQLGAKTNAVRASFGTTSILGGVINGAISISGSVASATPSVTIGGGDQGAPTINGEVKLDLEGAELNILSGNFANDVSALLPSGKQSVQEGDSWTIKPLDSEEDAAAKVVSADGTVKLYQVAATALADLSEGDTFTLLKDSEAQLVVGGITATIDLGGHKLTSSANPVVNVSASDTSLTITNGSIVSTCEDAEGAIVGVYHGSDSLQNVTLTLEGVELSATHSGNAGIIVQGNNVNNSVTLRSCELSVPSDVMGIYFPPVDSVLNVIDTNITAGTGIGLKGGVLNVEGTSSITATGEKLTPGEPESSGIAETGDAIYIEGNYTDREVTLNVKGGTLESENGFAVQKLHDGGRDEEVPAEIVISGGSFSSEPAEEWFAEGYEAEQNEDGSWGVTVPNPVAEVDGQQYPSLAAAVSAASDGDTITLLADAETTPVTIGKGVVLDLGGHKLSIVSDGSNSGFGLDFTDGESTLKNGSVVDVRGNGSGAHGCIAVRVVGSTASLTTEGVCVQTHVPETTEGYNYILRAENGASLTLGEGTSATEINGGNLITGGVDTWGAVGVAVIGTGSDGNSPVNEETATKLTVNSGATVSTSAFAISGNGNSHNTIITISGGEISSKDAQAVYHPQNGNMVVNGGTITGDTGIEMRSGKLEVNGGSIVGTGTPTDVLPNGNGSTTSGAGIAVSQHTTKLPITVKISGGEVSGYTALYETTPEKDPNPSVISLEVTGGTFTATNGGTNAVYSQNKTEFISGGTFSSAPAENLIVAGSESFQRADGTFGVAEEDDIFTVTIGGETSQYARGEKIVRPADPTRAGYTFSGWADSTGALWDFDNNTVTDNVTLAASWLLNPPTVTLAADRTSAYEGDTVTLTATVSSEVDLGYTTEWLLDGKPVEAPDNALTLTATEAGSYSVRVTATDADGLVATATSKPVEISFSPAPDADKDDKLAQTGDVVSFLPAVVAGAAGITAAAGALTLRRRSK